MSVTINLFFIYVNIFRLVSPLVKVTYTNTLTTDTDTYRLVYTDKLLVLTNLEVFMFLLLIVLQLAQQILLLAVLTILQRLIPRISQN